MKRSLFATRDIQRALTMIPPALAFILGVWLLLPPYLALRNADSQLVERRKLLERTEDTFRAVSSYRHQSPERAVPRENADEPISFLNYLSELARESKVQLTTVREGNPSAPSTPGKAPAGGTSNATEQNNEETRAVVATVTIDGPYAYIVTYLSRLERGERVVAIKDLKLAPSGQNYPVLSATFTLTRFVSIAPTQIAAQNTSPSKQGTVQ